MKNIFVLYGNSGIHSGRVLGTELMKLSSFAKNFTVERGKPDRLRERVKSGKIDTVVNVGCSEQVVQGKKITILNNPEAIANTTHKYKARKLFKDKEVPAPELWFSHEGIPTDSYPVVGRTSYHSKGQGFWFCKNKTEAKKANVAGATHFLRFIPNTREFRIHVISPEVNLGNVSEDDFLILKVSEKLPKDKKAEQNQIIKNHDNGWVFSYPKDGKTSKNLSAARAAARKAVKELGLHWGAVDILISRDTNKVYVLEVNTSPCLTDETSNTLEKYAEGIGALIGLSPSLAKEVKEVVVPKKLPKKLSAPKNKTINQLLAHIK